MLPTVLLTPLIGQHGKL